MGRFFDSSVAVHTRHAELPYMLSMRERHRLRWGIADPGIFGRGIVIKPNDSKHRTQYDARSQQAEPTV